MARSGKKQVKIIAGVVLGVVLLLNLLTFAFSVVRYYGDGMTPTLKSGQMLVIDKIGSVSEGDIIAFYYNNKVLVRRVVSTGGKQVEMDSAGTVSVNGKTLEEPYLESTTLGQCNLNFPYSVPAGHLFVLGDNRSTAMDSRLSEIGTVPEDRVIGKVLFAI